MTGAQSTKRQNQSAKEDASDNKLRNNEFEFFTQISCCAGRSRVFKNVRNKKSKTAVQHSHDCARPLFAQQCDVKFDGGGDLRRECHFIRISPYNVEASVVVVAAVAISEERMKEAIRVGAFWFLEAGGEVQKCMILPKTAPKTPIHRNVLSVQP